MANNSPEIHKIDHIQSWMDKIKMENNNDFEVLVIKPGSIQSVSWMDPNYSNKLVELDLFKSVTTNQDNFFEVMATNLDVDKYKVKDLHVKNEIIGEEPYYVYEMIYIDLEKEPQYHTDDNSNEFASLLNINGDKVYSNVIIFKNYLPSFTDSMYLETVTKNDIARLLRKRVHTTIVTCDEGKWTECESVGDLNNFAEQFFDDEKYDKLEIPFLMHNINIWYTTALDGDKTLCGTLIKQPIDKCIWFTMKTDEYRGNLTLDEVKKIIYLSKILSSFMTPSEHTEEKIDNIGRKIINNKYKVLDLIYKNNQNI
jgi:hypothetical protein